MAKQNCNGGQTNDPCPAALAQLNGLSSRELSTWKGSISCPVCNNTWRGDYWALNRWPGDRGSAFGFRRMEPVKGVMQVVS